MKECSPKKNKQLLQYSNGDKVRVLITGKEDGHVLVKTFDPAYEEISGYIKVSDSYLYYDALDFYKYLPVGSTVDTTILSVAKGTFDIRSEFIDFIVNYRATLGDLVYARIREISADKKGNHKRNKDGELQYKAGDPNGWLVEQGGYPPLAFGFSDGQFYIKANSDRRWLTDKDDRCNASPKRHEVLVPVTSEYKASTIAYKMPFEEFPKDCWVEFTVEIDWTVYGREKETILKPGRLDVVMQLEKGRSEHIVDNARILIGRNDDYGYYFKFGIYRVGDSTVPVSYNLAGYSQTKRSF
jgi:hypothetical protein